MRDVLKDDRNRKKDKRNRNAVGEQNGENAGQRQRTQTEQRVAATRASELIRHLLAFSRSQVMNTQVVDVNTILREGTSSERQVRVFEQTGDLKAVVRHIVAETKGAVTEPRQASVRAVN